MRVAARLLPSVEPWAVVDGAVLIGIAVITGTHYDTIDDVLINAFAAGRLLSSAPDEHLIYTNVIIGFPLKFLYLMWGAVPWYGLYLIVSLALSAAAFLWAFAELQRSWTGRALVLAFLVGTIATTFSNLQFTRVAFLAVESGWLLVASALTREGSRARGAAAAGAVLVLLGTCIRSEIGLLGTLLSAPLILAALVTAGRLRTWRDRLRLAALPAAVVLIGGLLIAGDIAYYRAQPSWRQYLAYHNARSTLLGTARGEGNEIPADVLAHVGWSGNDLSMMYSYFGINETVLQPRSSAVRDRSHRQLALAVRFQVVRNAEADSPQMPCCRCSSSSPQRRSRWWRCFSIAPPPRVWDRCTFLTRTFRSARVYRAEEPQRRHGARGPHHVGR